MKQKWKMSDWTLPQMEHRDFDPIEEDGCIINGCVPADDFAEQVFEELESEAVSYGTVWEQGEMPVFKMDDAFRQWRKEQIEQCKALISERITCLLPWQVLKHLPAEMKESDRLYFSQGAKPSCSGHADAFAHHSTTLQLIARGAPLVYTPFNPIVTWAITKGGSTRGGQCMAPDQLIYTATGPQRAADLADSGKPFIVLSFSKRKGRVAAKNATARYSTVKPCVRVTTDKGVFETSSDHPFMLSTGEFVHAENLKPGQSLMQVSTDVSDGGYVRVNLRNGKKGKGYLHRLVMSDIRGIQAEHVHHKDGNPQNNEVDNLVPMSANDHARMHLVELKDQATEGKRRYYKSLNEEQRSARAAHLHCDDVRKRHSQSQILHSGYKIINSGSNIDSESGFFEYYRAKGHASCKIRERLARIVKAFGSYDDYAKALSQNNHRVVSVETTGLKRVVTISVDDPEPDDKRPWSEHNYMIVPEGQKGFAVNGICVANTIYEMGKGANGIGHFPESLVGGNNQSVPSYKSHLEAAKLYQSALVFLNFKGSTLADEIIQSCAAGLSVALGNSTAVSGSTVDKNGVKVATIRGSWAHASHFTAYRVVNGTEYIGWVNSHGSRYKTSDEGEPADMCWMTRALVEQFVATASGYGAPYIVIPESIFHLDRSLYVKLRVPFPNNWRF